MSDDLQTMLARLIDVCPGCEMPLGPRQCCFTYSTWHCWGCGATLDGRVVQPKTVLRCDNEWPDYRPRRLIDPPHPIVCVCAGRGWVETPQ